MGLFLHFFGMGRLKLANLSIGRKEVFFKKWANPGLFLFIFRMTQFKYKLIKV